MNWFRQFPLGPIAAISFLAAVANGHPLSDPTTDGSSTVTLPPVLRPLEPPDTTHLNLPGPPPAAPKAKKAKSEAPVTAKVAPVPKKSVEAPVSKKATEAPVPKKAEEASAPPPLPTMPVVPPKSDVTVSAPVNPERIAPAPFTQAAVAPVSDLQKEIALFCQKEIGHWKQTDAQKALGQPTRHRAAYDEKQAVNGTIYAYADPTGRYKELELDFDRETGNLRSVFVYPLHLTWQECQRLWTGPVTSADANRGRKFYSYSNRRLDVLVDPTGKVISLGWY
jgi:hypothetical protein